MKQKQQLNKTSMTREDTEKLLDSLSTLGIKESLSDEQLAAMHAYIRGESVQSRDKTVINATWSDCAPSWSFEFYDYRVKPAPVRPYTLEEFAHHVAHHLDTAGTLRRAGTGRIEAIVGLDLFSGSELVVETRHAWLSLDQLASHFTWEDGTPCGMPINE